MDGPERKEMVKLPSGSKLSLAFKCQGSVLLPQVKDEGNERTDNGKAKHATLEKFWKGGRSEEGFTGEDLELVRRASVTVGLAASGELAEFGLALDPSDWGCRLYRHGRDGVDQVHLAAADMVRKSRDANGSGLLGPAGGADTGGVYVGDSEAERAQWLCAVADLVQRKSPTSFAVWDWKTSSWVQDPEYNWQLILPAIWLYCYSGQPAEFSCELGAVYIEKPDGNGFARTKPFTADQLFAAIVQMQQPAAA